MNAQQIPPYPQPVPVLIVDEDPIICASLRTLLNGAGCTVAEAHSEADALQYLRGAFVPHVVLLDFFLPLATRSTVLHVAKQNATLRRHCYVFVTGADITSISAEEQCLIHDICVEVVAKPPNAFVVLAAVSKAARRLATST